MATTNGQPGNLPFAAIIVTTLAAGGVFLMQEPLSSHRHKEPAQTISIQSLEENVDARLWQDPMYAVNSDWAKLVNHVDQHGKLPPSAVLPHTITTMRKHLENGENGENGAKDAQIRRQLQLFVMMPSLPYADDAEHRRRQRYALVSALAAAGYSPEFADRIGYFIAPGMQTANHSSNDDEFECADSRTNELLCPIRERPLVVGYESYSGGEESSGRWDEILVLWLARAELGNMLLPKIRVLTRLLRVDQSANTKYTTVFIGPDDSGGLLDMFTDPSDPKRFSEVTYCEKAIEFPEDARAVLFSHQENDVSTEPSNCPIVTGDNLTGEGSCVPGQAKMCDFYIISTRSTVPLSILFPNDGFESLTPEQADRKIAEKMGITGFYTILARDDKVIKNIIEELQARGLNDCRAASGIAVVSEVDSSYGRALPKVVEQAIADIMGCRIHVHSFGYLRGVDGELPPNVKPSQTSQLPEHAGSTSSSEKALDILMSSVSPERAAGAAQTDYIRRLAERIAQRHVALSEHDHEGFRAIGILGTDVYDKQLLIHALREKLPAAIFFTTDLDARLNDPNEYKWARNLLIGSAYGLTPPESELDVAPLRGNYQTAFFQASKLALDISVHNRSPALFTERAMAPPPRLFEIGRSGAIDITVCDTACLEKARSFGTIGWLRHSGGTAEVFIRTLLLISPLLVLALVSLLASLRLSEQACQHRIDAKKIVAQISGVTMLIMAIILWSWNVNEWEPWLLTAGISSVPTLMLHVTALIYSICFLFIVRGRILQHHINCGKDFGLLDESMEPEFHKWKKTGSTYRNDVYLSAWTREIAAPDPTDTEGCKPCKIWARYRSLSIPRSRLIRILPYTVFWTLVVWLILSRDANPLLARHLQGVLDFVRMLTVFAVLGVIFACVDTLRLGQWLIRALVNQKLTGWKYQTPERDTLDPDVARLWRKMELIVVHTELMSPLIVLPFIVLFLLLLARMTLFEGWVWTPSYIAVYLGFSVYLLIRAWLFQREASNARDKIVENLERRRIQVAANKTSVERTDYVLDQIRAIHQGAFVPWTRHPLVQSILLPAVGVAILSLLGLLT